MRNQKVALIAFSLNPLLWASFYTIGKHAIELSNPIAFSTMELLTTLPIAVMILLLCVRGTLNSNTIRGGIYAGFSLYAVVLLSALALNYTSATETAFFPALNGIIAALIALVVKREQIQPATWIGGVIAGLGACVILPVMHKHLSGNLLALGAALAYTAYLFVAEKVTTGRNSNEEWPIFAVELITMAVLSVIVASVFHLWNLEPYHNHEMITSIFYVGLATTVVPTAISILYQQSVKPVTVAFLYSFEPVWCAILSFIFLGESLPALGYAGGLCIVLGAINHTAGLHYKKWFPNP